VGPDEGRCCCQKEDIKAKIEKRADQLDAKAAATDADWAEQDAADALDYAVYVIYDAQLAVLDALDARAYAERTSQDSRRVEHHTCAEPGSPILTAG
jgi:hypothetical protein